MAGVFVPMRSSLLPLLQLTGSGKASSRHAMFSSLPCLSNKRLIESTKPCSKTVWSKMNLGQEYYTATPDDGLEIPGNQDRKIFANFAFYKGKSAMNMTPMKPVFKFADSGSAFIHKEGALFVEIAPAIAQRKYDWNKKQVFALSILELGTLLGLSPDEGCEFYHDPNMGKGDAGMVRKVFKVEPMADKSGYFFNLAVNNKIEKVDGRLSIAISKAEFSVIRSAINFIIPYLMGWHVLVDPNKLGDCMASKDSPSKVSNLVRDPTIEWTR